MTGIAETLTDVGNGQRFAQDHRETARWLIDEQEWLTGEPAFGMLQTQLKEVQRRIGPSFTERHFCEVLAVG